MRQKKYYLPKLLLFFVVCVGIAGLYAAILREKKEKEQTFPQAASKSDETFADMGNAHIDDKDFAHEAYNSIPPTSGPHVGTSLVPWGIHDKQIADELQVHNLEDGGVVIHYDPVRNDGKTIEQLQNFVSQYATQVILEPYTQPPLPMPIVLTAWTRRLTLEHFDEERMRAFIEAYRGIDHHRDK